MENTSESHNAARAAWQETFAADLYVAASAHREARVLATWEVMRPLLDLLAQRRRVPAGLVEDLRQEWYLWLRDAQPALWRRLRLPPPDNERWARRVVGRFIEDFQRGRNAYDAMRSTMKARARVAAESPVSDFARQDLPGEMRDTLYQAIEALQNPVHRRLLEYALEHGSSRSDLAAVFEMSPHNISRHLYRARQALKKILAEME